MPGESLFCLNRREVGLRAKSRVINSRLTTYRKRSRCRIEFSCKFCRVDYGRKNSGPRFRFTHVRVYPVYPSCFFSLAWYISFVPYIAVRSIEYLSCTDQRVLHELLPFLEQSFFFYRTSLIAPQGLPFCVYKTEFINVRTLVRYERKNCADGWISFNIKIS